MPRTRTCSPRRSTGWSRASASRTSASARSSPARCSSTRATSTSRASPCSARALDHATPAYDIQQACDTGLQAAIAGGEQDRARPDRLRHRRRRGHDQRRADRGQRRPARACCSSSTAPRALGRPREAARAAAPGPDRAARSRATRSRAPACRWASTQAITAKEWGVTREEQDELAAPSHQHLAAAYDRGLLRRPRHAVPRPRRATTTCAPTSTLEKLAKLKPVFGEGDDAHDDRGQLDAAHRRRVGRAAGDARSGPAERKLPVLAYLRDAETAAVDYVARRRRPADGAGLRGAAAARPRTG